MSQQQGLILVVSDDPSPVLTSALGGAAFPIIQTSWAQAMGAVAQTRPIAVVAVAGYDDTAKLEALAAQVKGLEPYLPLIAINPKSALPENAIPFTPTDGKWDRLPARLRTALRVRTLHTTVLRRLDDQALVELDVGRVNPVRDATVLLVGRGGGYPALSVALGECMGVVGALSIEAAAKHLNARDIDGIVLSAGFTDRVVEAFLTVLGEDPRFRNLPIIATFEGLTQTYDLPNLEVIIGEPAQVVANGLPLIRQHVLEAYLGRTLRSIDAGGLLDPHTGLLTTAAFDRDFAIAVRETLEKGGGLSVAQFTFDPNNSRAQLDGARLLSRLMRQMDFGALHDDGTVLVAFTEADLRTAQLIARRVSSVMRHTVQDRRDGRRSEPAVSIATLQPSDTTRSLLARLNDEGRRAAS
jgi:hypothetical protein